MTELRDKAFEEASRLPETNQNALVKWILDGLNSEKAWGKYFANSEDILENLADEAIREKLKGKTTPSFLRQNHHQGP